LATRVVPCLKSEAKYAGNRYKELVISKSSDDEACSLEVTI